RQREAERTIERMAYHDPLTGLPNRTLLNKRIGEAIGRARSAHRPLALLAILLNHFNELSDTLGHHTGNRLLLDIVRRIEEVGVREDDVLARIGADQFALLLSGGAERASEVARRIVAASYEPLELDDFMLDARAAVGVALFPGHADEPDELMRRAEVAMYRAKHAIDSFAVYSNLLDRERARRLMLMGDLRSAIDHNDLLLYCQPKVHMASRRLCGAEALVRWRHDEHGMISPGEFVTLAEQTGLITPLTSWVLEAAFSQRYAWHEQGFEQPLAVNLSIRDLRDPRLLDRVGGLFATWGIHPDWMQFEITESALMDDPEGVIETLRKLKGLGVKLLIDDFGTGYSSLSYLQRMPVDSVKIDQTFVRRMVTDEDSATIVRSTIELTHSLALHAIAEGVESEELWQRLAALGCDACQGYYVGEPLPAGVLPAWARESRWQ
ncbi:MAG: bifunctional diguanylate cyclase/phosphodiesterase, partial [Betaproteobacteria bacterium]